MRKVVLILSMCLAVAMASAQQNLKVAYSHTVPQVQGDTLRTAKFILMSGSGRSLYYNQMSLYVDSLTSTPDGEKRLHEIQLAAWKVDTGGGSFTLDMRRPAPRKQENVYAEKDFDKSEIHYFDKFAGELGKYSEPFDELQWEIKSDSTATLIGYDCFMAEADYHGRVWKAWFAPEIPVQDGPWKLQGLPGLILKAETDNGAVFEATGVEVTSESIPEVYQSDRYARVERRKGLAEEEHYRKNYVSTLAAQGIKITGANGAPYQAPEFVRERHALERDY